VLLQDTDELSAPPPSPMATTLPFPNATVPKSAGRYLDYDGRVKMFDGYNLLELDNKRNLILTYFGLNITTPAAATSADNGICST
jgi:hypothetical protein